MSLVFGLFLFALAIAFTYQARLGLWPWDVFHQGIALHTPLSFGTANVVVGIVVLFVAWALGGPPGLGTLANAVLVGLFIDGLLRLHAVRALGHEPLAIRILFLAVGIALAAPGSAFYIGADLGAGPRDTLMLVGARRTGVRVGLVRAAIEVSALVAGIALGGHFGVGTVVAALLLGPSVEAGFWLLARSPLAAPEAAETQVIIGE